MGDESDCAERENSERCDTIICTWQDDGRREILRYLAKAKPVECWPLLSPEQLPMKGLHKIKTARIYAAKLSKSTTFGKTINEDPIILASMNLSNHRCCGWGKLVVAVSAAFGWLIGIWFWSLVMIYLWIGLLVVLLKPVEFALPA